MPTILQLNGLRIVIYSNDHRPAHVHAIGNGFEAVFQLHCPDGPPELRENYGFSHRELERLLSGLARHAPMLCAKWRQYHGTY
jgi:Domain of unknown function (DUF4160)